MSGKPAATLEIAGQTVRPGERADLELEVAESYLGTTVSIPLHVWRAKRPGPTLLVVGAVHGDEINGAGIVREIMFDEPFDLSAGSLVLVPVVNLPGFERHSRYMPDRRDLNRAFPGSPTGSMARRYADAVFTEIVKKCDWAIDLHTPAVRRTGFPNIRANLKDDDVARIAYAFGCGLVVNGKGPRGSIRREACKVGCPTIVYEGGETLKFEPSVIEFGVRGVRNVLIELGMVQGKMTRPVYQARVDRTKWVRAAVGGVLRLHVGPGDLVDKGQPIATTTELLGAENDVILAPVSGVVIGLTTLPAVSPGGPVCHIGVPAGGLRTIRKAIGASEESLHQRVQIDLATNIVVSEHEPNDVEPAAS